MGWLGGKGIEPPSLGSKDQTSQMTYVIVNIRIMIEYFVPIKLPSLNGYLSEPK
jgi:hypothetical protein